MTLGEYIKAGAARPWVWGSWDCCVFMADWCIALGNPDPMAFIRGTYDSERSALRRIEEGDSLTELWTRGMIEAGIPELVEGELRAGDVGLIWAPTEDEYPMVCAIYTGDKWATLGLCGLSCAPAEHAIVWRP